MPRVQAGLIARRREVQTTPLRDYTRLVIGRVVDVYPEHGLVDIALERGDVLRRVAVAGNGLSSASGTYDTPQVWNSRAVRPSSGSSLYDRQDHTLVHDVYAIVGYADGFHNRPVVLGFLAPNAHQQSFPDPTLKLDRDTSDIHTLTWSDEGIDLRPTPYGGADKDHPNELLYGNWQLVFPDRQQDYPVPYRGAGKRQTKRVSLDPATDFGNDHQTYLSVGYHDRPRVFGDGTTSANYDYADVPWTLSSYQKGDTDTQGAAGLPKGQQHARGIWLNQRWRSRLGIDTGGNVTLRAEGLGYDSTAYQETDKSEGTLATWSRLESRRWQKHHGSWTRMRPRYDGGGAEDVATAKRTGTEQLRVQRLWDVAVRKDAEFRIRDGFTLRLGDFDSRWHGGDAGDDPGIHWEEETDSRDVPVLNPAFKTQVGDDSQWQGDDFLDAGNLTIEQRRGAAAKASGAQQASWSITPQAAGTDAAFTLTLAPADGSAACSFSLSPSSGNPASFTLTVGGPSPCGITCDGASGIVNVTGVLQVNGVTVIVP